MSHGPEWNPFILESGVALGAITNEQIGQLLGPRR